MMTLEEAIKHCEEVAEAKERSAKLHQRPDRGVKGSGKRYLSCLECAKEHRQLAEWLKELKEYRKNYTCFNCYNSSASFSDYPCCECRRCFKALDGIKDHYEEVNADECNL